MAIISDYKPRTIEEAAEILAREFKSWERGHPGGDIAPSADRGLYAGFQFGRELRNAWGLWDVKSPINRDAQKKYGIAHGDDLSGLIEAWAAAKVAGLPFDPIVHCQQYVEHWADYGLTPITAVSRHLEEPNRSELENPRRRVLTFFSAGILLAIAILLLLFASGCRGRKIYESPVHNGLIPDEQLIEETIFFLEWEKLREERAAWRERHTA